MNKNIFNYTTILFLLVAFVGFNSCREDQIIPQYNLSGNVSNSTERPVSFVIIELFTQGESIAKYTSSTNNSGEYQFENVEEGTYNLTANAQGYNETTIPVEIIRNTSVDITILGSANTFGTIINSQTGNGLSNATVSFTVNQSATTGDNAELQVNTNSLGNYTIVNGPTGDYTCIVEAVGFFTLIIENISFSVGNNEFGQETIVERPDEGTLRVILTWGENPSDLDSHLTGPSLSGSRFHVYWLNQNYGGTVNLDVDDTFSYGPETITISSFLSGMYRYSVHNWSLQSTSGGSQIAQSPTKVEIYDFTGKINSYTAPAFTGNGNTWRVFEINISGTNATINSINIYVQASSSNDVSTFRSDGSKKDIKYYLDEL